ncbi:PAS domain-containing protein [Candidatus Sumerlaeota bacterium]|nr:PAS domain-containing protein [Candidatus Sumerlaeota bacterium]
MNAPGETTQRPSGIRTVLLRSSLAIVLLCFAIGCIVALASFVRAETTDLSTEHPSDLTFWAALTGSLAMIAVIEGVIIAIYVVGTKKRRLMRTRTLQERDLLRSLVDTLPDLVYFKDSDSRFLFDNVAHHRHLGVSGREKTTGKTDADFYPSELADRYHADEIEMFKTGRPLLNHEEPTRDWEGREKWILTTKIPWRDAEGKIAGVVGIGRDITELKRTREELQKAHKELTLKAEEVESANIELSQYAYVVSHDLKAPLRAMRNYADFLAEDLEGSLTGEQKQYLEGIANAVMRAERLVEDLLTLSRLGTQMNASIEKIETRSALTNLIHSLGLPRDVEIQWEGEWPVIETSPLLFNQVFQNLILNGVKFNRSPQKRLVLNSEQLGHHQYQFSISDNGIGIDPRHHSRIFNVFQRLHTSEEYEGTGIGLAIVRKAATLMHGSVQVESSAGKGSTFHIVLPSNHGQKPN